MIRPRDILPASFLIALFFASPVAAQEASPAPATEPAPQPAPMSEAAPPEPQLPPSAEMKSPRLTPMEADWNAARAALAGLDQLAAHDGAAAASDPLDRLNAATAKIFPNVAASSVPVLLPFDTAAFLRDRAQDAAADIDKYFSGFRAPTLFYPGPSGYDSAFAVRPQEIPGVTVSSAWPVRVEISASTLIYELDGPADASEAVPQLESEFPGIRRVILESRLRYFFTRFGMPYFVSILCHDGRRRGRLLSCREADQVAVVFLKSLRVVGGAPPGEPATAALKPAAPPEQASADFTYYAPGDLLPGTGMQGRGGRADTTVYSIIRFPIAHAPAYVNSQSFMNWGNCDLTGIIRLGGRGRDAAYRCRVNELPLVNDETRNYAYPWRDNFCEHRHYEVVQCPAGLGHQGEDIRPSTCKLRNEGADRCEPYQDDVVAVRDGMALRAAGDEALYLVVDAPGEHERFRYLHMNPHMLDLAGMVSGRALKEGEVLAPVGDYGAREGGTSYHLHFNMQVPTRQGWIFVNPYMTLVASYEGLIGGRGRVVSDPLPAAAAAPRAMIETAATAQPSAAKPRYVSEPARERKELTIIAPEPCPTRVVKGYRRSVCGFAAAWSGGRGWHGEFFRAVDRRVSRKSDRARHHTGDLRAGHERAQA